MNCKVAVQIECLLHIHICDVKNKSLSAKSLSAVRHSYTERQEAEDSFRDRFDIEY